MFHHPAFRLLPLIKSGPSEFHTQTQHEAVLIRVNRLGAAAGIEGLAAKIDVSIFSAGKYLIG
jgi:hypothetical protein